MPDKNDTPPAEPKNLTVNTTCQEGSADEIVECLKQEEREAYLAKFRAQLPENKGHTRVS